MISPVIDALPRTAVSQATPVTRLQAQMQAMRRQLEFQTQCQRERLAPAVLLDAERQVSDIEDLLHDLINSSILPHSDDFKSIRRQYREQFGDRVGAHLDRTFGDKRIHRTKNKNYSPVVQQMLDNMNNIKSKQRASEWLSRATIEVQQADMNGWFIALDTLTVTDEHMHAVFYGEESSKIWSKYKEKVARACRAAHFGGWHKVPKTGAPLGDYHRCIAVAEEGDLRGRPHIHIVHLMRALPEGCTDPNAGREHATEKDIKFMASFWKYGGSKFRMFRLHQHDAWAKIGYRWQVELCGKVVMPQHNASAGQAAGYVCKYIIKSYNQRNLSWRVKATQGFGTTELKKAINRMPVKRLLPLAVIPPKGLTLREVRLPGSLVKTLVQREVIRRYLAKSRRAQRMVLRFPASTCRPSLVVRYMSLMTERPIPNLPNIGSFGTVDSNAKGVSELQFLLDGFSEGYVEAAFYAGGVTR